MAAVSVGGIFALCIFVWALFAFAEPNPDWPPK